MLNRGLDKLELLRIVEAVANEEIYRQRASNGLDGKRHSEKQH